MRSPLSESHRTPKRCTKRKPFLRTEAESAAVKSPRLRRRTRSEATYWRGSSPGRSPCRVSRARAFRSFPSCASGEEPEILKAYKYAYIYTTMITYTYDCVHTYLYMLDSEPSSFRLKHNSSCILSHQATACHHPSIFNSHYSY